jgi:hypothetical protein
MAIKIARLHVERLIVHEIPARPVQGTAPKPRLSQIDSPLNQDLKNYFRERVITGLADSGYEVLFAEPPSSPVPRLIHRFLSAGFDFIKMSRRIARHLYTSQTAVNSSGLLVVIGLSYGDQKALAILKLEKEQGVRVRRAREQDKRTFSIQHLKDLMLTQKTRVFKVGVFVSRGKRLASIEGLVSDNQRGYRPTTEVADFFLSKFLGCVLRDRPDVTTKRFFHAAETFINDQVDDPQAKAQYQMALLSELQSQRASIRASHFAETHLLVADRKRFISHLEQQGVPTAAIDKNTSLIDSQLSRMQIDFQSGIAVFGTPESFEQHVKMKSLDGGQMRVEIEDRVKKVRAK